MEKQYIVLFEEEFSEISGRRNSRAIGITDNLDGMKSLDLNAMANGGGYSSGLRRSFIFNYKEWTDADIQELKSKGQLLWDFRKNI